MELTNERDSQEREGRAVSLARHKTRLAAMPCLLDGGFSGGCGGRVELHHVAEGSGLRDDWALVPLCAEHHRGQAGLHGMGSRAFCALYRPPGDAEWGLLVWLIEEMARNE